MSTPLTRVALLFVPDRVNLWLRFGHGARERIIDAHRRVIELPADSVFGRVLWRANDYGTTAWQLTILQAARPGEAVLSIAGIAPGAHLLLRANGTASVPRVLRLIDAIEARGIDPCQVAPAYWRTVHNRLAARAPLPEYTPARHAAQRAREAVR